MTEGIDRVKVLSLFSGIGAFEKALKNKGVNFDLIGFSEIDKYAVKSYCAIHGVDESKNLGDITKIDETALPKDIDLITYGFPCQDISLAGKQKGLFNEDGTQTRSGLFFEALRIIEATKPKFAIAENVKNLTSKKFAEQFKIVLESLKEAGYNNYYKVLNAKDYGIPQNRERVFIVSIRKDIDNGTFKFPEGFPLELRLKDMLDIEVDEKFYLSKKMKDYLAVITEKNKARGNGDVYVPTDIEGVSKTITTKEGSRVKDNFIEEPQMKQIGQMYGTEREPNPQAGRIYDADGISPTLDSCGGGNRMPKIEVVGNYSPSNHDASRIVNSEGLAPTAKENHGTVTAVVEPSADEHFLVGGMQKNQATKTDGISTCLTSSMGMGGGYVPMHNYTSDLRIRKLTPKECWRLMGFDDSDFEKAEAVNSNTQLYKQAGNSIVVNVLEGILGALLN